MSSFASILLGKLSMHALQHSLVQWGGIAFMVLIGLSTLAIVTYFKKWKWLWKEWITTLDPKKIGVMYIIVALVMLVRGGIDALMMRTQQATSVGV